MVNRVPTLGEAKELFRVYCKAKGLSPRTIETYLFSISRLERHLGDSESQRPIPHREDLRRFAGAMLEQGLSRQTIRVRMRSIRVFANFLEREGIVPECPMNGVEIPRVPFEMPQVLSVHEMRKLLHAAKSRTWYETRNRAILATFLDCGLRLGELISLQISDVDLGTHCIDVRWSKSEKTRHVFVGVTSARDLRRWVGVREFSHGGSSFFCSRSGSELSRRCVGRIIERIAARAGLADRRIHPHLLHYTFATHFIKNGGDPFTLQRLLGHSDIRTTMIYVNLAGADLEEAHAKASPLDRLT